MSFTDRLVLWLHIGLAIFTIGPVTVAISSTPRYIRTNNLAIVGYLYRMTRIFTFLSLTVLIAGLILAQQFHVFSKPWLTASLTLFVVAIVLLVLIMRDQHRAIVAMQKAGAVAAAAPPPQDGDADEPDQAGQAESAGEVAKPREAPALAAVERGRIATMGGVTGLIWLVILVLMVWNG
ncbi:MAG TPA: hypothetical protein VH637_04430 [Streptosporangiaceae bacterium]|jgi:uncharacterized membrane protein SirB2